MTIFSLLEAKILANMEKRKVLINKNQIKRDMKMKNIMQRDMRWALKKLMNSMISKLY